MSEQMHLFLPNRYLTGAPPPLHGEFHPRSMAAPDPSDGGSFDYASAPQLFLGRKGVGPLRLAWDTNILIDWAEYGHTLIEDESSLPSETESSYAEELLSLGAFMNGPWMTRDVRIYPLRKQIGDFKRDRGVIARSERERQLARIAAALWHTLPDEDYPSDVELLPGHRWELRSLPASTDRELLEEALVGGCHAFVCRDRRVLGWAAHAKARGLKVLTPAELISVLSEGGELNQIFGVDGMVCDSHKWQHLWEITTNGLDVPLS